MIALIDYGAGNLQSVQKAFQYLGSPVTLTADPEVLRAADAVVLPGVGAFGDAMAHLKRAGLVPVLYDLLESDKPFLGICLGLQLLFEGSEETPGVPGLGIFRGTIRKIPAGQGLKVPHIGWNSLQIAQRDGLFAELPEHPYVYFVHSYYLQAADRADVAATTQYGVQIDAAVRRKHLYAVQFHPEKSGAVGLKMLRNFSRLAKEGA